MEENLEISAAISEINLKLNWAISELSKTNSISGSRDLIGLIKDCSETLLSLKKHL